MHTLNDPRTDVPLFFEPMMMVTMIWTVTDVNGCLLPNALFFCCYVADTDTDTDVDLTK